MKHIILIGGMPTAGKSTVAAALAKRLNLPWFSTDQIRTIMEATTDSSDYPLLFNAENHTAQSFLSHYSASEIADMEYGQADEVWPVIRYFINKDWVWSRGFVLEGVNITPKHVHADFADDKRVQSVFLSDVHEANIRKVVHERGLFGPPQETPDHLKKIEVEWPRLFDEKLRADAKEVNLPVVDVTKTDEDVPTILRLIGLGE